MPGESFDAIVVGAGPAGSHLACELASSGYDIAVFEEKGSSGQNVCCTGIISTECFHSLHPRTDVILSKVTAAKFFSPSGRCLSLETEDIQAYVVNRLLLDRELASRAQARGARYFFSSPVIDIILGKDGVQVAVLHSGTRQIFTARAVVLASGFRPKLPGKLGLGRIRSFLVGAQAEIEANDISELEVYFGQEMGPGSFAWLVPTAAGRAYAGLLATSRAKLGLQRFLQYLFDRGRIRNQETRIEQKAIPSGALARSYGDRIIVIGDAAGQAKPTTGGGIYFGHLGAQMAADVLREALTNDRLSAGQLSLYQKQWKAKIGRELSRGRRARRLYSKLSDGQIEGIFKMLSSDGTLETLLKSGSFSFDWHSNLVLSVLRHSSVYPLLKIRGFFLREANP